LSRNIPETSSNAGYIDEGELFVDPDTREIKGWGNYWGGWSAEPVRIYFAAAFDTEVTGFGTWKNDAVQASTAKQKVSRKRDRVGAYVQFKTEPGQKVHLKIAVSFSSMERARKFLDEEIPAFDYAHVEEAARAAWNSKLNQIQVEGASPD